MAAASPAATTAPLWLSDTRLVEHRGAALVAALPGDAKLPSLLFLDATVAHPQGGGQPGDRGVVLLDGGAAFAFASARWGAPPLDGAVAHAGWWLDDAAAAAARADPRAAAEALGAAGDEAPPPPRGALAEAGAAAAAAAAAAAGAGAAAVFVAANWRARCARLHSAGHLLDGAVRRVLPALGALLPAGAPPLALAGGKGRHFPDSPGGGPPSVEYAGALPPAALAALPAAVNAAVAALVAEGARTRVALLDSKAALAAALEGGGGGALDGIDAAAAAALDVAHFPEGRPLRLVAVGGADNVCPCGGTHVRGAEELAGLVVVRATSKKGVTKLVYAFEGGV